jgi:hypothetical protein
MNDDIKINKPPTWYTAVLVIAGLALFIGGFLIAKHFLDVIRDSAAYFLTVILPLPMMLGGLYVLTSALRQKIVVDKDKITFVDGVIGEEVIKREDVDAYVLRQNAGTLEVKRANKPDKEVFSIVAESDESLKAWLKPEKAVSEFLPDRPFNPNLYPKKYKPSIFQKIAFSTIFIVALSPGFLLSYENQSQNYVVYLFPVAIILFLYYTEFRFLFGYSVVLHADRIEVKYFPFFKVVINRKEITFFRYDRFGRFRQAAVCLVTKSKKLHKKYRIVNFDHYVVTRGNFEQDRDFIDWFNTLEAETDFPIPRLREEVK